MKAAGFELHEPTETAEAVALLAEHEDEAKVLAGGQSLVPMLALRLARFEHLIDLNRIDDLAGVSRVNGSVRIGAMTRHRTIEKSLELASDVPLLSRATRHVGHFQIRNRGTIGGAVSHADPAAEQPAVCLALDAVMELTSQRGRRDVSATDFFEGTWATALAADEILTALRFEVWPGRSGFAVEELARRHGDFALVGVTCGLTLDTTGKVSRAALALFGVGATPVRASQAESALLGGGTPEDAAAAASAEIDPTDDLHATADYRRRIAGVLVRRAIETAHREASNE